jgi:hypothetical protein
MASSGMLRRVALERTDVSEDLRAYIIFVYLGSVRRLLVTTKFLTASSHPDDGGAKFLRNVGSYKSHTV